MNRPALAMEAVRAAARLRSDLGVPPTQGVCPYDIAIKLGIKVSFLSAPTLEGMYSPEPEPATIILGIERPPGRRRYTCAHELGHHVFKHGYRLEELDGDEAPATPEEYLAQRFASALLMPKLAVDSAFTRRGWKVSTAKPEEFYIVAQELGVGYATLVWNTQLNLKGISASQSEALRRVALKDIRQSIAGISTARDVFLVDQTWERATVDVDIDDLVILPKGSELNSTCVVLVSGQDRYYRATKAGSTEIKISGSEKSPTLRVSRPDFTGLARYRHLEEADDE